MPRHRTGRTILVLFIAWILFVFFYGNDYSTSLSGGSQRVLLLTAHPDDECNADGLGDTRELELRQSLRVLGIPNERSLVTNHPLLQDNFTQAWNAGVIAEVVKPYIVAHDITTILTFDEFGISQHPNHISLLGGASHLLGSPGTPSVQLFALRTVPLLSKYLGPVAHPITKLGFWLPWTSSDRQTYVTGIRGYITALRAMYQHQSQLVWFRWLYVLFSRYMWVNDWYEIDIPGAR